MRKKLGQHFLFDPNILRRIMRAGKVTSEDTVVEIGPGLGTLTKILSENAGKVIAIELDRKLADKLEETFASSANVEIIRADALKFPYDSINGTFKVVANIPYYITTPLLFRLIEFKDKIAGMTLLMQKEVARRIVASPDSKEYGVLSISAQVRTKPVLKFTVPRGAFSPPPDVDSAVVHFDVPQSPHYENLDENVFMKIVRKAFSQRRKTILNGLKSLGGSKEALKIAGINPELRPENLNIDDFVRLTCAFKKMNQNAER